VGTNWTSDTEEASKEAMTWIVASDEAGYGAWAGNLVVAGAAVPPEWSDPRVKDSKKFSGDNARKDRQAIFHSYIENPGDVILVIRVATSEEIDQAGVYKKLVELHTQVTSFLKAELFRKHGVSDPKVIVDGNLPIEGAISIPKADSLVPACSLASCVAKSHRDSHMESMASKYPGYGFSRGCGYGTPEHMEALRRLGPCPIHRMSYAPIKKLISSKEEPREAWDLPDNLDG
jgi:ribonuclease HII